MFQVDIFGVKSSRYALADLEDVLESRITRYVPLKL